MPETYTYPILEKVFDQYINTKDLSNYYLVCCQHLLEPQLEMFRYFIQFGFKPSNIIVLGKVYSTNVEILQELQSLGINATQPVFSGKGFDEEHTVNCTKLLNLVPVNTDKLIILDDGGELIKVFADTNRKILFAVEQTSSGFRKLENKTLSFPVINVARSKTKLTQESPLTARHAFERVDQYCREKNIVNPKVLIVGLGPVGEAMREVLNEYNFSVSGFDIAKGDTYLIGCIKTLQPNIVIGATGTRILQKSDIEALVSDGALHFISISSADREFPVESYRSGTNVHDDVMYKNITFVNNGFPITFKGNRYELTPIEAEKTVCLLGGAVAYGITADISGKGLIDVPEELEEVING